MKKLLSLTLLLLIMLTVFAPFAFAEEAKAVAGDSKLVYYGTAVLASGIAIGVAAFGTGIGMGLGLKGATEGVARNPGASGKITTTLIIGLAMIESLAIYALVVVLIVLFANPFKL
ncbi:MAG TPA: ATP synthase F0 subunit C [Nitrospiraceae bacterium]|nr:ATP synthase F0 subunit C [Nitrospiraceae bacterium]